MRFRKVQIAAFALFTSLALAAPATAQLGGLVDKAKKRAEREAREAAEQQVARALFPLEEDGADLRAMSLMMDGYAPKAFNDLSALARTDTGGFILTPGSYQVRAESFCLKPGAYGKPGGNGYMSGTLTGKLGPYLRDIMANAYRHPDLPRDHIQSLIWSVIAGVNVNAMSAEAQAAAARLLTPQQVLALNGPDAFVPAELSSRALRKLPRSVRQAYDAQLRLRRAAAAPDVTFTDLERIAVLDGEAPSTKNDVPKGRWSWHPDGYFIRYDSSSYRRALAEIVVPEQAEIIRDAIGRITEMRFANGDSTVVTYASDTPIEVKKVKGAVAFPIATAILSSRDPATGQMRRASIENTGHIFVSKRSIREASLQPQLRHASFAPMLPSLAFWQPRPFTVVDLEAIEAANERREYYQERYERLTRPPSQQDIDDFLDMGHYSDGIEAAFGGPASALEWIIDHHERQNRALAYATTLIESLGDDAPEEDGSGGLPVWEPSEESAMPAREGYAQRLGLSGRSW